MKSILGKLGVILIGLTIFGYAEVRGADWKPYGSDVNYSGYYDAQSITHPSKNIVRMWVRYNWKEIGVLFLVGKLGKEYEKVSHSRSLAEINCLERTVRTLSVTSYDNKGNTIISSNSPTEWMSIIPESQGEGLYKEVCK